jgi:hypothetical protein
MLERLEKKLGLAFLQENAEQGVLIMRILEEIRQTFIPFKQTYGDNRDEISAKQTTTHARNMLCLTTGLHRALIRETSVPLEQFKSLGVQIAGLNLDLGIDPSQAIPLTSDHFLFLSSLSRKALQSYRVVVIPASNDRYFFEELMYKHRDHFNRTGYETIVPASPIAYTELIRLEPFAASSETKQFGVLKRSSNLVTSSLQAIAIAELSALRSDDTILPDECSELRAFAGYTSALDHKYQFKDYSPSLMAIKRDGKHRNFDCDSFGSARPMACSLEWSA